MISTRQARDIAADWHGGQGSALYMFASSGYMEDARYTVGDVLREVRRELHDIPEASPDRAKLVLLAMYLTQHDTEGE